MDGTLKFIFISSLSLCALVAELRLMNVYIIETAILMPESMKIIIWCNMLIIEEKIEWGIKKI